VSVTEHKDTVMAGMVKQTEGDRLAFCLVGWLVGCDVCGQAILKCRIYFFTLCNNESWKVI